MANVYSVAFSIVGVVLTHACLLVWTALLAPRRVARAAEILERRPWACLAAGVLFCLATAALDCAVLLARGPIVALVTATLDFTADKLQITRFYNDAWIISNALFWLPVVPLLAAFVVGGGGFSTLFADAARARMRDDRRFFSLACGAFCTSASYFVPLVGWFLYLPIVGLMSIGAGACGLWPLGARRLIDEPGVRRRAAQPELASP